jgi:pyrophosphate--fructose-6-phosphate 1-phosphotransferase
MFKKPVIRKALVELNGKPFQAFSKARQWALRKFLFPGNTILRPSEVCDQATRH